MDPRGVVGFKGPANEATATPGTTPGSSTSSREDDPPPGGSICSVRAMRSPSQLAKCRSNARGTVPEESAKPASMMSCTAPAARSG